jgi:hypothetical protein
MELSEETVLDIWEMFVEHLPASKRNDLAVRFLTIFVDQEIELTDLEDIRGEDEHLDHAFDVLMEESEESDGYGDSDEYED